MDACTYHCTHSSLTRTVPGLLQQQHWGSRLGTNSEMGLAPMRRQCNDHDDVHWHAPWPTEGPTNNRSHHYSVLAQSNDGQRQRTRKVTA